MEKLIVKSIGESYDDLLTKSRTTGAKDKQKRKTKEHWSMAFHDDPKDNVWPKRYWTGRSWKVLRERSEVKAAIKWLKTGEGKAPGSKPLWQ